MSRVLIVDYGIGNLLSVARAFEKVGCQPVITSDHKLIANADRLVLPGVGAFGHCMDEINARSLKEPIIEFVSKKRPLLCICVGMQVLHSIGKEFGEHKGLGFIEGMVDKIPQSAMHNIIHKLPYVGWSKLIVNEKANSSKYSEALIDKWFYFVHGFMATPKNESDILAYYNYNDVKVVACTAKDNIIGTQFHPEKSSEAGLSFIKRFISV
jgi:glutamine amidotransferase